MSSWVQAGEDTEGGKEHLYGSTVLDNGVLFLKRKIMRRPKLYEVSLQGFAKLAFILIFGRA